MLDDAGGRLAPAPPEKRGKQGRLWLRASKRRQAARRQSLERELQRNLLAAGRERGAHYSGSRGPDGRTRIAEVRVVEGVEHLPAEGRFEMLPNRELAVNTQVHIEIAGANQGSPAGVPECISSGDAQGRDVKPVTQAALIGGEIGICPVAVGALGRIDERRAQRTRHRTGQRRSEVRTRVGGPNAGEGPLTDNIR